MNRTVFLLAGLFALSAQGAAEVNQPVKSEQFDRDVDEVALASQQNAISRMAELAKKYSGTRQEPVFLAKLGDLRQQNAAILFRIAHGSAHRKKTLDLSRYKKAIDEAIGTFSQLITKYPGYPEISHSYLARAKAYEEISDKTKAARDYTHIVTHFPYSEEAIPAHMSLAELAIEKNQHAEAVKHLNEVEKHPESPHFPYALYKLAWSHYNLKNIPSALRFAERHVAFYADAVSDTALRENTLIDIPLFYFEGYEQKDERYSLDRALAYFKSIESGPILGKMNVRLAKLLRSRNAEADLFRWKDILVASESERPETVDVILVALEYELNHRQYAKANEVTRDIVNLYNKGLRFESFDRARKMVLDAASSLQQVVLKNKGAEDIGKYSRTLADLYESFTRIVDEKDPRIPQVHYNLAETLFAIQEYDNATIHYRWVVDHASGKGSWKGSGKDKDKKPDVPDSSLKAIASRYEHLRAKGFIPKEVKAQALSEDESDSKLEPLIAEWVQWLDTHVENRAKEAQNFRFEAYRTLYARKHLRVAIDRLENLAREFPSSTFAVPSASLVLDTLIASEDWEKTHAMATDLQEIRELNSGAFEKRLFVIASDSFYKQAEKAHHNKDFPKTLDLADEFLERYSKSARSADLLSLAASAAMETSDKKRAEKYLTQVIALGSAAQSNLHRALLNRASLSEEKDHFAAAAADYRALLKLPKESAPLAEKQVHEIRKKTLLLSWLAADSAQLRQDLQGSFLCDSELGAECERYTAWLAFEDASLIPADKGKREEPLWVLVSLKNADKLSFNERNRIIRDSAKAWDKLDPLTRFAVLPRLLEMIPRAVELSRTELNKVTKLRANPKSIKYRVEAILEIESAAAKAMKLPWARIRSLVLNQTASLYLDLARGLANLPAPKDLNEEELQAYQETVRNLTIPFEEKGQDLRQKAFDLAAKFAVEESVMQAIAEPFFAENPSQAKKLKTQASTGAPDPVNLAWLDSVETEGDWPTIRRRVEKKVEFETNDPAQRFRFIFAKAVQAGHWQQVAFLLAKAEDKNLIKSAQLGALKAVAFATAGARSEGLAELEDVRNDFDGGAHAKITRTLIDHYQHSYNPEKAADF